MKISFFEYFTRTPKAIPIVPLNAVLNYLTHFLLLDSSVVTNFYCDNYH